MYRDFEKLSPFITGNMLWVDMRPTNSLPFYVPGEDAVIGELLAYVSFENATQLNLINIRALRFSSLKPGMMVYYCQDRNESNFAKGYYLCYVASL
jgi:hypothetical protein